MKHVSILIPAGQYSIVNIAGSFQILNAANDMFFHSSRKPLFEVEFVAADTPAKDADGFYTVNPKRTISQVDKTDLIIVPAVHGDLDQVLAQNEQAIQWIRHQHQQGAELASFCIGVYLIAQAGLLNGRPCSTHWGHVEALKQMFPEVNVQAENFVTESNGIYTSGGAYAFTNLIIYLIEKYGGRELAILTAKSFMIDIDKGSQSTFMIFNAQKDHQDDMVLRVQESLEENYKEKVTVDELADEQATVRRTLERRFKKATGNSVNEYLQRVRMEAAKKQFELGRKTVSEVMFNVGYSDVKAFRDIFKRFVGISPVEYRDRYNKNYLKAS